MARDRNNKIPGGLSFLMWSALVRAPWLFGSFNGDDDFRGRQGRQRDEHRARKYDR
jgi:hypothetical protein